MEKGGLHDMLGGIRFQTTVTITFFSSSTSYYSVLWLAIRFFLCTFPGM